MSAMRVGKREPATPTPGAVVVRLMSIEDVATVARLERESFTTPWSARTFRTLRGRPGAELWVAEHESGGVVGYYVLWCIQDQGELANIAVETRYRGQRIGAMLLDHALEVAASRGVQSVYLEVRVSNAAARAMYESRGFEQIGVRRNYYDRPREDACVLMTRLEPRTGDTPQSVTP
jgi:[ribosomal protein S18]-alanine N-acetyltransferase